MPLKCAYIWCLNYALQYVWQRVGWRQEAKSWAQEAASEVIAKPLDNRSSAEVKFTCSFWLVSCMFPDRFCLVNCLLGPLWGLNYYLHVGRQEGCVSLWQIVLEPSIYVILHVIYAYRLQFWKKEILGGMAILDCLFSPCLKCKK